VSEEAAKLAGGEERIRALERSVAQLKRVSAKQSDLERLREDINKSNTAIEGVLSEHKYDVTMQQKALYADVELLQRQIAGKA
jgi:polyhydroxyalkanoate synthesis regulator phasin